MPSAPDRFIGTLIDQRYRVIRQVGRGGAGIVYEAEHEAMARRVAVKVLGISLDAEGRVVDRFRREARAAGRLNHPHVVTVHDYGAADDHPFMVMEYCEGGSLADQLRTRGTLPLVEAVGLMQGVCAAMDAAHDAGIVHRDLKPGNILFAQGVVKVADFGLAHLMEEEDHTLTAGHIIGSPHYSVIVSVGHSSVLLILSRIFDVGVTPATPAILRQLSNQKNNNSAMQPLASYVLLLITWKVQ